MRQPKQVILEQAKLNDELAKGGPDQLLKAKACVALINSAILLRESVNESYLSRVDNPDNLVGYLANVLDVWNKAHPDLTVQDILVSLESIRHKLIEDTHSTREEIKEVLPRWEIGKNGWNVDSEATREDI